jgi:Flp pilus assembly protein TadB
MQVTDKTPASRAASPARVSWIGVAAPELTQNQQQSTRADQRGAEHAVRDLALYSLARLGLIVLIAAILVALGVPLVLGVGVGVIAGYPLSLLIFRRLGARASTSMNRRRARRSAERERLRAELRGDGAPQDPAPGDAGSGY